MTKSMPCCHFSGIRSPTFQFDLPIFAMSAANIPVFAACSREYLTMTFCAALGDTPGSGGGARSSGIAACTIGIAAVCVCLLIASSDASKICHSNPPLVSMSSIELLDQKRILN